MRDTSPLNPMPRMLVTIADCDGRLQTDMGFVSHRQSELAVGRRPLPTAPAYCQFPCLLSITSAPHRALAGNRLAFAVFLANARRAIRASQLESASSPREDPRRRLGRRDVVQRRLAQQVERT